MGCPECGKASKNGKRCSRKCIGAYIGKLKRRDISGQKFGMLTGVSYTSSDKNGGARWKFVCDCGNRKEIKLSEVTSGKTISCGCHLQSIRKNIGKKTCSNYNKGDEINNLTVIGFAYTKNQSLYWNCLCDCGKTIDVESSKLNTKNKYCITSCGCVARKETRARCYSGNQYVSGQRISQIVLGAKNRKINCVSKNRLLKIIKEKADTQNMKCSLCGIELLAVNSKKSSKNNSEQKMSIDRIDSNKGYCKSNIQITCITCNRIKNSLNEPMFLWYIKKIYEYQSGISKKSNYMPVITEKHGNNFKGYKNIGLKYFNQIKNGCCRSSRTLDFDITIQHIWEQYKTQGYICNISGIPIDFNANNYKNQNASIDRIDNNFGYTINNIQIVHKDINRMRLNYPIDTFLKHISAIYKWRMLDVNQ